MLTAEREVGDPILNEKAIRETVAHITANPQDWSQAWYGVECKVDDSNVLRYVRWGDVTMCFGGHALTLASAPVKSVLSFEDAQALLGLTFDQADRLFYWMDDDTAPDEERVRALKARVTEVTGVAFDDE